jgi:hypothetical protein
MNEILEYRLIASWKHDDLVDKINIAIRDGWQPLGGVSSSSEEDPDDKKQTMYYAQAVVKYRR